MEAYQQRVVQELADLKEKSNKLEDFLISEMVEKLEQAERSLLVIQLQTMNAYAAVLSARIKRWTSK